MMDIRNETILRIELSQDAVNTIVEELNINGNNQSLVDNITEQSEMQRVAYKIYCGVK